MANAANRANTITRRVPTAMIRLLTIGCALVLTCFAQPTRRVTGACLHYEPQSVTLEGRMVSHQGLRGWWGLQLDRPICSIADESDPTKGARFGATELQLLLFTQDNFDRYRQLLGTRVTVKGKLTPQVTGYHETAIMIMVDSIVSPGVPLLKNHNSSEPPVAEELIRPSLYWASVTVLPNAGRVAKQAWETDSSKFFPQSDRYVAHFFNGPKDVMWVNCGEGYAVVNAKSQTASPLFRMEPDNPRNTTWGISVSDQERSNITVACKKN